MIGDPSAVLPGRISAPAYLSLFALLVTHQHDQEAMKPRKTARQGRSTATVEAIVEAAARILEVAGPSGLTTNAIADRAGVSVGSLYQYFPNKDAITRALIRRELKTLEVEIMAIGADQSGRVPLTRFVEVAVAQQMRRPALARSLDVEEDRLAAEGDLHPVRVRVSTSLAAILAKSGYPVDDDVVQDIIDLVATLVNAAASRGEHDAERLALRVQHVVLARLGVA